MQSKQAVSPVEVGTGCTALWLSKALTATGSSSCMSSSRFDLEAEVLTAFEPRTSLGQV
jgi:hypothetical protein